MVIIEGEEQEIELEFKLIEQFSENNVLTVEPMAEAELSGEMLD